MALFILFLAVLQCVVALVGALVAHLLTNRPRWRPLRGRAVRAALFAALGSFVGGLAGYVILAAGVESTIALPVMGALYVTGFVVAGRNGWRRGDLAPDFESDPI